MRAALDVVNVLVAAWALFIGWKALNTSQAVQNEATRERERADERQRLMYLHDVLNKLSVLTVSRGSEPFESDRQWIRTMLALSGAREQLPVTAAVSDLTFDEAGLGAVLAHDEVDAARREILKELEYRADRAYAGEKLS